MSTQEKLPFFVYGTLMTGFGNNKRCLNGVVEESRGASLDHMELYDVSGGAFPGMVAGSGTVAGELIFILDDVNYSGVLAGLDSLEGYVQNNQYSMYNRIKADVRDKSGNYITAWTYIWNRKPKKSTRVTDDDWRLYCENMLSMRKGGK